MRANLLLLAMMLSACGPSPHTEAPAPPHLLTPAPAEGAEEELERARTRDALLAAAGEARASVDAAAQAANAPAAGLVVSSALTEVLPSQPRTPRHGGSAVLLLADPASPVGAVKNLALCQALFESIDTPGAAPAGEAKRPIYWLTRSPADFSDANTARCVARLLAYDYPRAERLTRKLGLSGAGPFLAAERHDLFDHSRIAAVIDLAHTPPAQIPAAMRYFRDQLLPADTLWAPESFAAETTRASISAFLDDPQSDLPFAPRLVRAARSGDCPPTDLTDTCATAQ